MGQGTKGEGAAAAAGVADGGEERRTFSANVAGRSAAGSESGAGFWEGLAARPEVEEPVVAKGLEKGLLEEDEKGPAAKGFADAEEVELPPKRAEPRSGLASSFFGSDSGGLVSGFDSTCVTRVALTARMLPGFRRQAFRLHAQMYSCRSWPGKRSGSSPFSCRRSDIGPRQVLHCANANEGGSSSFNQI